MTFSLKHTFVSAKGDPADTTLVRPSNWNAEHTISMATAKVLGRATAGTGAVEELSATTSGLAMLAAANAAAQLSLLGTVAAPFVTANYTDANVTYAKIQNVSATNRLLGRATAAAGVMEEITIGTGLALSGTTISATQGGADLTNLSIKVATNTTVAVACDTSDLYDGSTWKGFGAFATTVNLGTTGAGALDAGTIAIDSWYHIWLIGKADGTKSVIASLSSTAPTMPSGYTYKKRVGAVQTIHASATLYGTWQFGRQAQYVVGLAQTAATPLVASGTTGNISTPTWTAFTVVGNGSFVPSTASRVRGTVSQAGGTGIICAPNSSYGGNSSATNAPPIILTNTNRSSANYDFLLESNSIYFACSGVAQLYVNGWEDNI